MADNENLITAPSTQRAEPSTARDGVVVSDEETDREEYISQLESQLQDLRGTVQDLQRQVQTQTAQVQIPPLIQTQSMPPPITVPFSTVSQPTPQQFYYPFANPGQYSYSGFPPHMGFKQPCTYKQFLDCKPSEYHGTSDPNVTMNWVRDTEKALDACSCEAELRVRFATRMLKGSAMVWWDSLTAHFSKAQMDSITWEQFQAKLCEQYCNAFEMSKIRKEFMDLQMTERMSVDDLIRQFNEKLRFVQQWVPDESSQVQHFIGALLPEYRSTTRLAGSLSQAFTLAKSAEGDVKARELMTRAKAAVQKPKTDQFQRKKWQGSQSRKAADGGSSQRPPWCSRCRSSHAGPCTTQTMRCPRCGVFGHEVQACKFPRNVCWNCQKEGHMSRDCPSVRKTGSGPGAGVVGGSSSSAAGQKRKNPPPVEGRAFRMTVDDATTTDDVITGMFLINSIPARVLFDSGANRSFISVAFCDRLKLPTSVVSTPLEVKIADGNMVPVTTAVSSFNAYIWV